MFLDIKTIFRMSVLHKIVYTFNASPLMVLIGFFFYKIIIIIIIILAELGLCCYMSAFSSCGELGLLFVAVRGLLIAVASLVAEHGL